jgi:hypothetical protein
MDPGTNLRDYLLGLKQQLQEALKAGKIEDSVRLVKEIQTQGAAVRFYPRNPTS